MKVVYAVESLDLSGGVRVIVQHAGALARLGHDVSIVSRQYPTGWIDIDVPVSVTPRLDTSSIPPCDILVATWFPTVLPCVRSRRGRVIVHFCQGYEGDHSYLRPRFDEVYEAYAQQAVKLVVSPALIERLEPLYPGEYFAVPPAIDTGAFRPERPRESPSVPPAVGIAGPFEFDLKGVAVCLQAAVLLEERGMKCRIRRVSQLPRSPEEGRIAPSADYVCSLPAGEMPAWYRSLDLFLFGSFPGEGLGLPPLEAMACGVPAVLTDIPSLRFVPDEAVTRVPAGDPEALANAAFDLLTSRGLWRSRAISGAAFAGTLTVDAAARSLERTFLGLLARNRDPLGVSPPARARAR
ncbi:MAG: glycosyltransferase family 4 protein [Thermoanaerobaculia bacterium]|nr:glycosyltransferase family 4 protein [Thermoanaerobaculia bacterium]